MSTQRLSLNPQFVQNSRSMHLRCPPNLNVTQEEYLDTLRNTAQELELPLQLEVCGVEWEGANLHQQRIRAKLNTPEQFGLLTGLDYVGRVAFVEQKTYLDPPDLPAMPKPSYLIPGAVAGIGLLLGLLFMAGGGNTQCLGLLFVMGGIGLGVSLLNNQSKTTIKKREEVKEKWAKDVTDLFRRAEVSNELNRMGQALDEAVKLAVSRLFTQRGAEMEADEKRRLTAAEFNMEVERLKKEGFK